ncbi:MAG: hypothetical protein AB7K24_33695 [Gemmataceae bacterium]
MKRRVVDIRTLGLLATVLLAGGPSYAQAAWLGLRNDTGAPIVVQAAPGRPMVLLPGEITWENVPRPTVKAMQILGAKPPRPLLFQGRVPCGNTDMFFSIRQVAPNRVNLLPAIPPAPPPRR